MELLDFSTPTTIGRSKVQIIGPILYLLDSDTTRTLDLTAISHLFIIDNTLKYQISPYIHNFKEWSFHTPLTANQSISLMHAISKARQFNFNNHVPFNGATYV